MQNAKVICLLLGFVFFLIAAFARAMVRPEHPLLVDFTALGFAFVTLSWIV